LRRLAETDPLTALLNRRSFTSRRPMLAIAACDASGDDTSLIIVDLDRFKSVNDSHGHAAGDAVIRAFADLLLGMVRSDRDLVGRFGGEEFAVFLPRAGAADGPAHGEAHPGQPSTRRMPVSETLALRSRRASASPRGCRARASPPSSNAPTAPSTAPRTTAATASGSPSPPSSRGSRLILRPALERPQGGIQRQLRRDRLPSRHLMPKPGDLPLGIGARIGLAARDRLRQRQDRRRDGRSAPARHGRASPAAAGRAGARAGVRPRRARLPPSSSRNAGRSARGSPRARASRTGEQRQPVERAGPALALETRQRAPGRLNTSSARMIRIRSLGFSRSAITGSRPASSACSAAVSSPSTRARNAARTASGTGGIAENPSVSALK
jgi:diguanylate cyclase (GGDEF)-like protein